MHADSLVCRPSATDELQLCVSDLIAWMTCYRGWQLFVYSSTTRRRSALVFICSPSAPDSDHIPVRVGCTSVQPVTTVRNLGIYLDGDVSMRTHVTTVRRVLPCYGSVQFTILIPSALYSSRYSLPRLYRAEGVSIDIVNCIEPRV